MSRLTHPGEYVQPDYVKRDKKDLQNPSGSMAESSQFFGRNVMPSGKNKATIRKINVKPSK